LTTQLVELVELHDGLIATQQLVNGVSLDHGYLSRNFTDSLERKQRMSQVVKHAEEENNIETSHPIAGHVVDAQFLKLSSRSERIASNEERFGPPAVDGHHVCAMSFSLKAVEAVPTADIQQTSARQVFGKSKSEIVVLKLGELVGPGRDSPVAQVNAMPPAEALEVGSLPGGRLPNTLSKRRITHLIQSSQTCYQFDMRIALDGIPLVAAKTGVGHYTNSLATWLARTHEDHQYELLTPFDFVFESRNGHRPSNLNKHFVPVRSVFRKWWLIGLPTLLQISPVDVFHGTNYCIPVFAPCPTIVTIHDLSLLAESATHEQSNVTRGRRRLPIMARRATMIVAPSEWTRREIVTRLGIRSERIRVIYEAAREGMRPLGKDEYLGVLEKHGIRQPYLLYVGTIEPRKNLTTLVRAYEEVLRGSRHHPDLVICGGRGWLDDEVFKLVKQLGLVESVRFTGYVEDEDLPAIYSGAEVFAYPSVYEGFGLPPLEAMACGIPVVTSNTSSLPEVVADAGVSVPPRDVQSLAQELIRLLDDTAKREHFGRLALERAATFSWERAANETQAVYDEAFERNRRAR
jgi:glycosyltransferase involved in cell wall biosynthesis